MSTNLTKIRLYDDATQVIHVADHCGERIQTYCVYVRSKKFYTAIQGKFPVGTMVTLDAKPAGPDAPVPMQLVSMSC